ncbi:MAG: transglutaminase domain-containing protein [Thermodesulfobacteriota bacterium]
MGNIKILSTILIGLFLMPLAYSTAGARERKGEVVLDIRIDAGSDNRDTRLWLPYPVSDQDQTIEDMRITGNFTKSGIYSQGENGVLMLYAEWSRPVKDHKLRVAYVATAEERIKKDFSPASSEVIPVAVKKYLKSTEFIPLDGVIVKIAAKVTTGKTDVNEKARAVYDWVVNNISRDPHVQGCGLGDVEITLAKRSGKCADISSVFVAVARAAGVPAREVFGLRLGKKDTQDITGGYHCWAEFYQPGYGWVPVDPADVRKIMLVKGLKLEDAEPYREYYFGAVDEYRIVIAKGRTDFLAPRQKAGPVSYFMYPYAEVDGKPLEWLAAQKKLKYTNTFRAIH